MDMCTGYGDITGIMLKIVLDTIYSNTIDVLFAVILIHSAKRYIGSVIS